MFIRSPCCRAVGLARGVRPVDLAARAWAEPRQLHHHHHQWSADTPEQPVSILALIHYRNWVDLGPIDLRGAQLSVYLRGDDLQTGDAACYFWVNTTMNRWHLVSQPLNIGAGCWADEPNRLRLVNDESQWHNSWSGLPPQRKSLDSALAAVGSYGFAFVGFRAEVTGRLSMSQFEIALPPS